MTWLTSDLHFGHKNVIGYCNRPFASIEEMNEALIANYNKLVHAGDTVWFLGDIFFCGAIEATAIMKRLNGTKILVKGNHDQNASQMGRMGFSFVCEFAQVRIGKTYVNLSHYPYQRKPWNHFWRSLTDKKYRSKLHFKKMKDSGGWLCHGHTHSKEQQRNKMIHVGVDAWDYKPIPITKISELINNYENEI